DGLQTRSFMYIDDCIEGIHRITESDILEPINLGSNELVTINGLVDMVEEIVGVKLNRWHKLDAPKGVNGRNSDNTLIQQLLGWQPTTPLRVGMKATCDWIRSEYEAKYGAPQAPSAPMPQGVMPDATLENPGAAI
ncbi:MAG: hypothetical protein KY475_24525, partial [Planctomycetes bacterium]|nr:hypothetical protein [Planctomycetota bacterium]